MRISPHHITAIAASGVVGLACSGASASIYLDFGNPSTGTPGGLVATGSEVGPAGVAGTWQAPTNSGDNQTLSGGETLRLVRGRYRLFHRADLGAQGSLASQSFTPAVGSVMANEPNVYSDFVRAGDAGRSMGLRLTGLDAGIYDIYLVINDASGEVGMRAAIGVLEGDAGNGPFEISNLAQTKTALLTDSDNSLAGWTASSTAGVDYNYIKATLTLDEADDYVVVFLESAAGSGSSGSMGIRSLQVVAIPEPASLALLALGACCLMGRRPRE